MSVRFKLIYLLQVNELYQLVNTEDSDNDDILFSVVVCYKKIKTDIDTRLFLSFFKTSSLVDDKILLLRSQLQSLFSGEVLEIKNKIDRVDFVILTSREQEVFNVSQKVERKTNNLDVIKINNYLEWNYEKYCGALIVGNSGSGKSYLIYSLLKKIEAITNINNVLICDCKFDELKEFALKSNFKNVAHDLREVREYITNTLDIVNERFKKRDKSELEPIFLIIDELAVLKLILSKKDNDLVMKEIKELVLKARASKVFLILSLQYQNSAQGVDMSIVSSLSLKILLGNNVQNFKNLFEVTSKDSEFITKDIGEGYYSINGGEISLFYSPYIIGVDDVLNS